MRDFILRLLVSLGLFVAVVTEVLSPFGMLRTGPLAATWTVAGASAVIVLAIRLRTRGLPKFGLPDVHLNHAAAAFFIASFAVIEAIIGWTAWSNPPNSADAMAYHLPRVVYWAQQGSVRFFPTPYLNQISLQPLAEYFVLHTYILSGGDRFANLIQWAASVGSVIGVSLVARQLGAARTGQFAAAFFCATLPNGILQASGAKNDYVLALWMVAVAYFALRFTAANGRWDAVYLGIATGLAFLTKATAYLYLPPVLIAILLPYWRKVLLPVAACAAGVLLLNGPQYLRNIDLSGSPLGFDSAQGDGFFRWRNERFGWRETASNVMRNVSEQLGARSPAWNQRVFDTTLGLHRSIGADPNDPATT